MWKIPAEFRRSPAQLVGLAVGSPIWLHNLRDAQQAAMRLISTIANYEQVALLVPPSYARMLRKRFSSAVKLIPAQYNDIWVRDTLPTFALGSENSLLAIDWNFNGWGRSSKTRYGLDLKIGQHVARITNAIVIDAGVVAEGGAFALDGRGLIVATDSTLRDPERNPGRTQRDLASACFEHRNVHRFVGFPATETRT